MKRFTPASLVRGFFKVLICAFGNIFLLVIRFDLTRAMFNHAIWGGGRQATPKLEERMIKKLKASEAMDDLLRRLVQNAKGDTLGKRGVVELKPSRFLRSDMYYALQHIIYQIDGARSGDGWSFNINVSDRFDFDNIRSSKKVKFEHLANDLGYALQHFGIVTPYDINVSYEVDLT